MYYLAIITDVIHAVVMLLWIIGLPLLFWHKYRKLSIVYAIFSITFIIVNLTSQYFLNRCILTQLSSFFWEHSLSNVDTVEWFSVRFSKLIFGLTPTHNGIKRVTEVLILISSIGGLYSLNRKLHYVRKEEI